MNSRYGPSTDPSSGDDAGSTVGAELFAPMTVARWFLFLRLAVSSEVLVHTGRESRASSHARALRGVQDHILVPKRTWDRIDS